MSLLNDKNKINLDKVEKDIEDKVNSMKEKVEEKETEVNTRQIIEFKHFRACALIINILYQAIHKTWGVEGMARPDIKLSKLVVV